MCQIDAIPILYFIITISYYQIIFCVRGKSGCNGMTLHITVELYLIFTANFFFLLLFIDFRTMDDGDRYFKTLKFRRDL
jgi:hypothetical protein